VGIGGVPTRPDRAGSLEERGDTYHLLSLRSRSGGEQWKRKANDGWENQQAVSTEIHSLEARGVNSAVWVLERARHES
jgi:hypothetical protein